MTNYFGLPVILYFAAFFHCEVELIKTISDLEKTKTHLERTKYGFIKHKGLSLRPDHGQGKTGRCPAMQDTAYQSLI